MPNSPPTWRLLLLAAACALDTAGVVGLALDAGCLWMNVPKL